MTPILFTFISKCIFFARIHDFNFFFKHCSVQVLPENWNKKICYFCSTRQIIYQNILRISSISLTGLFNVCWFFSEPLFDETSFSTLRKNFWKITMAVPEQLIMHCVKYYVSSPNVLRFAPVRRNCLIGDGWCMTLYIEYIKCLNFWIEIQK